MPIFNGQMKGAQLENLSSNPMTGVFTGRMYWNTTSQKILVYDGTGWVTIAGSVTSAGECPIGSIVAYNPGYYTDGTNGGFALVGPAGPSPGQINAFLPSNWRVCDGSALNDPSSPIWVGAGRRLPNLTDERFLAGSTSSGVVGGSNTNSHTHSTPSNVSVAQQASYTVDQHVHKANHTHQVFQIDGATGAVHGKTSSSASSSSVNTLDATIFDFGVDHASGSGSAYMKRIAGADFSAYTTGVSDHTSGGPAEPTGIGGLFKTGAADVNTTTRTADVTLTNGSATSTSQSQNENRPKYLSTYFIVRTK